VTEYLTPLSKSDSTTEFDKEDAFDRTAHNKLLSNLHDEGVGGKKAGKSKTKWRRNDGEDQSGVSPDVRRSERIRRKEANQQEKEPSDLDEVKSVVGARKNGESWEFKLRQKVSAPID
jgi:hypothetical protein